MNLKGHIVGANALRSVACLWVFLRHLARHTDKWDDDSIGAAIMRSGDLGVGMFFVLSGFLLSLPFWKGFLDGKHFPDLKIYAVRRAARIVPAYYLCVASLVLLFGVYRSKWDLFFLGSLLTFTNSFFAGTYKPEWNDPLWSIPIEVHFYFLLPVFAWGMFRCRSYAQTWLYAGLVLSLLTLWQATVLHIAPEIEQLVGDKSFFSASTWSTTRNSLSLFSHFIIGVLAAGVHNRLSLEIGDSRNSLQVNRYDLVALLCFASIISALWFSLFPLPHLSLHNYYWPSFPILIAAILVSLPRSRVLGPLVENRVISILALLSYGLYLWHVPVLAFSARLLLTTPLTSWWHIFLFGTTALLATCAVAAISYYLLEAPVMNWARQYGKGTAKS